jgi:hypothetical protein
LVYVENLATSTVWLQPFDAWGRPDGERVNATADALPVGTPNPVVAALPNGRFAVSWVDGGKGTPDIALRSIAPGQTPSGTPSLAHDKSSGAQTDPDVLWTGTELVVAWTDDLDVKTRRFDAALAPLEKEQRLASSPALEGNVALTATDGGWAAAWRASDQGFETIHAHLGNKEWQTEPAPPGPQGDHPALAPLDRTHILLAFSSSDYTDASATPTSRVRTAILDSAATGPVTTRPLVTVAPSHDGSGALEQGRPAAVRAGDRIFLAFEMKTPGANPLLTDAWLQQLQWSQDGGLEVVREWHLPADMTRSGHQRNPALADSPLPPGSALLCVWEDDSGDRARGADTDLVLRFRPVPFVTLLDASAAI